IKSLPDFEGLPDAFELPIALKVGDNISTDEIMRAGAEVLPYRSNIPAIAEFVYDVVDSDYPRRARESGDHIIIGGTNYGQGSSRERAAFAPRYRGLRVVIATGFARIHWQNLVNFGVLPLTFADNEDLNRLEQGDKLAFKDLHTTLEKNETITARSGNSGESIQLRHDLSSRQVEVLRAGGLINWMRNRQN